MLNENPLIQGSISMLTRGGQCPQIVFMSGIPQSDN